MFDLLLTLCFAIAFYRIAELDNKTGIVWAGLSAGLSIASLRYLHWGFGGLVIVQVLLFTAMWVLNALRD